MKQRGILFTGEMITAILKGEKTEARKTTKLDGINERPNNWIFSHWRQKRDDNDKIVAHFIDRFQRTKIISCPYGSPGDVLYFGPPGGHSGYLQIDEINVGRGAEVFDDRKVEPWVWVLKFHLVKNGK